MTPDPGDALDPDVAAELYVLHSDQLRRFLFGVLRDGQLSQDCLQSAFAKLLARGGGVGPESRKAWLFRVAYNEAMAARRRGNVGEKVLRRLADAASSRGAERREAATDALVRGEAIEAVRKALDELPLVQRQIVRMRIYEDKKFRVIADELGIPLGTALARMRAALEKMRHKLDPE